MGKQIKNMIECYSPKTILEIGCGMESVFNDLDMNPIKKLTIVEPSEKFSSQALQRVEMMQLESKVNVIQSMFETCYKELPRVYDVIICSSLLHEIENPETLLKCIRNVCNRETIVHINVPNAYSLHRLLAHEMGLIGDVHDLSDSNRILQQSSVFDMQTVCELIEANGFHIIDEGTYFCKLFTHKQMQTMLEMGIVNDRMLDGMDNLIKYMPQYGSEIYINAKVNRED